MIKPKLYFKDAKEANELLEEWKERLFLRDWHINLYFADELENNYAGQNESDFLNITSIITMLTGRALKIKLDGAVQKQPQEQILIHELLHSKIMSYEQDHPTIEGVLHDTIQHQTIEQLAKALYMAKYNLSYDWFNIKNYKEEK